MIFPSTSYLLLVSIATSFSATLTEAPPPSADNGTSVAMHGESYKEDLLKEFISNTAVRNQTELKKHYDQMRSLVIKEEELLATGGHLRLTAAERKVNEIFMHHKLADLSYGLENSMHHAAGMHFFNAKYLIENSEVFRFLQEMPKGATLHLHNSASVSSKWIVRNMTRMPGMLSGTDSDGLVVFTFRNSYCNSTCNLVQQQRAKARSIYEFDKMLERNINLHSSQPATDYDSIDKVWHKFNLMFRTFGDVLDYLPAYRAYHWRMLEELHQDNIMYAELRMRFKPLYGDNNETYSAQFAVETLQDLVETFKALNPEFLGIKVIFAMQRAKAMEKIRNEFETFKKLHSIYPDFIIGFDLVGPEEKGKSLYELVDILRDMPKTAKFFFHAGETNWYGTTIDYNLLDAILMNTTRIGHGYALLKHPILRRAVQKRKIAIEVSPLSNQVLHLVWDLRNHPAGFFMSENIPMVITNDDPGFWDAKGLSYDMYYAIMSFAPYNAGLKTLKNIVWNSIKYSALSQQEKEKALHRLRQQWKAFIDRVLKGRVIDIVKSDLEK